MPLVETADQQAWNVLVLGSQPIPTDDSRGHELHLAEWREVNGGVVVWRYQAFCTCYWSQRFPTYERDRALQAHADHAR